MTTPDLRVVWFRRDLRLHDHPALVGALRGGATIAPLFVIDPRMLRGRFASPNRAWFLSGSLNGLRDELERRGSRLFVRVGDPAVVVPAFAREVGAAAVHVSRDYTPFGRRRDQDVAERLGAMGVTFDARPGLQIHEPEDVLLADGAPYRVFTPFWRRWERQPMRDVLDAPSDIRTVDGHAGPSPDFARIGVPPPTAEVGALPTPGERAARRRLSAWLDAGPDHGPLAYDRTRDGLADPRATSRLGQDLRFGLLSPVEVATRSLAVDGGGEGARRFVSELAWRDFYAYVLWHSPRVAHEPYMERFARFRWEHDPAGLEAWRAGLTGYPIVDAAMRQLARTGFMPNRARMIVASFLTKDLLIDWRAGEAHFMRHLVDGDPASNLGGWQWVASVGADAQPYFRIFNPVTQARRFDPTGDYVRTWIAELAHVDIDWVHEPWLMSEHEQRRAGCRIGIDYPAPIVDHADARRRALARVQESDDT